MNRLYGLGSVFGKSLRDARRQVLGVGGLLGLLIAVTAWQVGTQFDSAAERLELATQMSLLPAMFHGLIGEPINIETLPGFISWRLMGFVPVVVGLWSITALSATLAGEASRGTLEMVLSMPVSRARVALEKFAAHVVALALALLIAALATWLASIAFAALPGDEMSLPTALGGFSPTFAVALLAGGIAFALGPLLGRALATGAASLYLLGAYVVHGYADFVPGFDVLRLGSVFYWTAQQRPMAGLSDWPSVAFVLAMAAPVVAAGVWLFVRRDLGSFIGLPIPGRISRGGTRAWRWTLAGVGQRQLGERLPTALGLGVGLGLYGMFIALAADEFAAALNAIPQIIEMIRPLFPDLDLSSGPGLLSLVAFAFMPLAIGLAAIAIVQGWASDERDGRLEILLAAPISRGAWALSSGLAVLSATFVIALATGALMAAGAAIAGLPALPVFAGALVIGLYGMALAAIGVLVSGLAAARWAAPAVAAVALGIYLLDLLGDLLGLPEWVVNLSLARHLGQPIGGVYDVPGMLACAVIALGGLLVGAWGFARRDLA
ncbi:exporter of polyketide antibiotics [soil metagenome]